MTGFCRVKVKITYYNGIIVQRCFNKDCVIDLGMRMDIDEENVESIMAEWDCEV